MNFTQFSFHEYPTIKQFNFPMMATHNARRKLYMQNTTN